jgi:hypothetical protein
MQRRFCHFLSVGGKAQKVRRSQKARRLKEAEIESFRALDCALISDTTNFWNVHV